MTVHQSSVYRRKLHDHNTYRNSHHWRRGHRQLYCLPPGTPGAAGLNHRVVAGSYSPADGQADPPRTTRAFANAASRLGATYWTGTTALALLSHNRRVTGVRTEGGEVSAEHVVLAAGTWSDELVLTIGLRLPIRTYALQMLLSTAALSVTLQPVLSAVSRHLSLKQLNDGAFLIGGGWLGDATPDRHAYTMRQASIEANWVSACELLPIVSKQQIARSWCGLEAESFDHIPFMGPAPGLAGLTMAAGFSGHGFAIAPAVDEQNLE